MPKPSIARGRLLAAAERRMLTKGFAATSVEEICEQAALTKGAFFHYFETKENLGKAMLERFTASLQRAHGEGAFRLETDPLKRVYAYVDFAIDLSRKPLLARGCLLGMFTQELSDTHPAIRALCARNFSAWEAMLKRHLDEAKQRHSPRAAIDTQSLAEHFIAILEGSLLLAKAKRDPQTVRRNLLHFKRYVKSLFGQPSQETLEEPQGEDERE